MPERHAEPTPSPITLADRAHTGLLVALWLEPDAAAELALPDGEPADALHITLAYAGDVEDLGELAVARAITTLERDMSWRMSLAGRVGGYGRFSASDTTTGRMCSTRPSTCPGWPSCA